MVTIPFYGSSELTSPLAAIRSHPNRNRKQIAGKANTRATMDGSE